MTTNTDITIKRGTAGDYKVLVVRVGDDVPGTACAELTVYRTGREDEWGYIAFCSCVSNLDDGSYKNFNGEGNGNNARTAATLAIRETVTKLFSRDTRGYKDYELADWAAQVSYLMSRVNR
jgi:hypothetical protein